MLRTLPFLGLATTGFLAVLLSACAAHPAAPATPSPSAVLLTPERTDTPASETPTPGKATPRAITRFPDRGEFVAFLGRADTGEQSWQLWISSPGGPAIGPFGRVPQSATISPNGRYMIYSTTESIVLFHIGTSITAEMQLPTGVDNCASGVWDPKSVLVAFACTTSEMDVQLILSDIENHSVETIRQAAGCGPQDWTPDGAYLAISCGIYSGPSAIVGGYLVSRSFSSVSPIFGCQGLLCNNFAWSPDAAQLAYQRGTGRSGEAQPWEGVYVTTYKCLVEPTRCPSPPKAPIATAERFSWMPSADAVVFQQGTAVLEYSVRTRKTSPQSSMVQAPRPEYWSPSRSFYAIPGEDEILIYTPSSQIQHASISAPGLSILLGWISIQ